MKKSRYTEHQIVNILKRADAGMLMGVKARRFQRSELHLYHGRKC